MQNYKQKGDVLDYTIPESTTITSGDIVNIGPALSGVAGKSGVEEEVIPVHIRGVFTLPKKASLVIAVGDEVYVDVSDGKVSKTTTHKALGVAAAAAASDDTEVDVVLVPKRGDVNSTLAQAAVVAAVSTADGSDPATTQALANQLKTSVNAILTSLKEAGLMASA